MPTYFDVVGQNVEEIDDSTVIYLVSVGDNRYMLRAISARLDLFGNDPHTHQDHYWPVNSTDVLNNQLAFEFIFPNYELRLAPITGEEVERYLNFDPLQTEAILFNSAVRTDLIRYWASHLWPSEDEVEDEAETEAAFDLNQFPHINSPISSPTTRRTASFVATRMMFGPNRLVATPERDDEDQDLPSDESNSPRSVLG